MTDEKVRVCVECDGKNSTECKACNGTGKQELCSECGGGGFNQSNEYPCDCKDGWVAFTATEIIKPLSC